MKGFDKVRSIITGLGYYALPNILHSCRSGNDREVTSPKTRAQCKNNPKEVGWLLTQLNEKEKSELKTFNHKHLASTHDDSWMSSYIRGMEMMRKPQGRWGTRR